jgi:hypothetical protein
MKASIWCDFFLASIICLYRFPAKWASSNLMHRQATSPSNSS